MIALFILYHLHGCIKGKTTPERSVFSRAAPHELLYENTTLRPDVASFRESEVVFCWLSPTVPGATLVGNNPQYCIYCHHTGRFGLSKTFLYLYLDSVILGMLVCFNPQGQQWKVTWLSLGSSWSNTRLMGTTSSPAACQSQVQNMLL